MSTEIYKYYLEDRGAFDVNPKIKYQAPSSSKWITTAYVGTIHDGQNEDVDPMDLGVPIGAKMKLIVHVNAQHDHVADEEFIYDNTSENEADYKITGTAFEAHLKYEGINN